MSGTLDQLTTSNVDGSYSFVNLTPDGDYSVSPIAPGAFVSPSSALFNGLTNEQTADFIAVDVPTVEFASGLTQVSENAGTASVDVLRPSGTTGQVSVSYATSDDGATAGIDYVATSGTLTFADGVASATISIPLINNSALDGERLFHVSLTNPTDGVAIAIPNPTIVSILDDEGSTPTDSGLGKTVTLGNVTVTYANVTVAGLTSAVTIDPNSVASAPNGYTITGPAYEVTTSANYTAPVNVCVSLPSIVDATTFSHLKILHGETDLNNQLVLVDRTTGVDFANHTVCSSVSSLSAFVIAQSNSPISAQVSVSGQITTLAGLPVSGATITLSGTQSGFIVTDNQGRYSFANLASNSSYTVTPSLVNYTFTPPSRTFSLTANKLDAVFTAIPDGVQSGNPIDTAAFFVRQHYLDFLGREPDPAGLTFWTNELTSCGVVQSCIEGKRTNVSAAFFLSVEFQETGYLVYRMYRSAYGNLPGTPIPLTLNEFTPDRQRVAQGIVVGVGNWQAQLESNKSAFALDFVSRARFITAYPTTMTPTEYVDGLFATAGIAPSPNERAAAIAEFGVAATSADAPARARVLRRVAENAVLSQREFNRAFVLMQYFGYLRRDPNVAPDSDFIGYEFWLAKLNQFNGNFIDAEMVKAFLLSSEYRHRFGP